MAVNLPELWVLQIFNGRVVRYLALSLINSLRTEERQLAIFSPTASRTCSMRLDIMRQRRALLGGCGKLSLSIPPN